LRGPGNSGIFVLGAPFVASGRSGRHDKAGGRPPGADGVKIAAIIAWAGWGVLLAALLAGMVIAIFERHHSPEVSPGMGPLVIGILLVVLLSAGGLLYWFAQKRWMAGVIVMAALFWWPGLLMAARPIVLAFNDWRWAREDAREAAAQAAEPASPDSEEATPDD